MARLYIGLTRLRGKLSRFASKYDLVEITPVDEPLPKAAKLARWREEVPPSFAFSVVLPNAVASFDRTGAYGEALSRSRDAIARLQAQVVVLRTPASLRPTQANRNRIAKLREKLPADGLIAAWEPLGIWEPEDVLETGRATGWLPVFDATQDPLPPGPVAYTRLRALGMSTQLGGDRLGTVARQLMGRRECYVVAEPSIGGAVKTGLTQAMSAVAPRQTVPRIFKPTSLDLDEEA